MCIYVCVLCSYESAVGKFEGAVRLRTRHFTDFPRVADELMERLQLRGKTVRGTLTLTPNPLTPNPNP